MDRTSSPRIGPDDVVARSPDLLSAELDAEIILLDAQAGTYYAVEGVARTIWEAIEPAAGVSDICAAVIERFDVDEETCTRDVLAFLERLAERNLIEVRRDG